MVERFLLGLGFFLLLVKTSAGKQYVNSDTGGIRVHAGFPGGSVTVQSIDQAKGIIRILPGTYSDKGLEAWWYFKVEGMKPGSTITIEVGGTGWSHPDKAQYSYDNRSWTHVDSGNRKGPRLMIYHHKVKEDKVWFAWGPPFVLKDANALVKKISKRKYAESFVLARSREGREIPALKIAEKGVAEKKRPVIWIQARQHAWEAGGSWLGRGFIEWLVSKDPDATVLRKKVTVYFVPIMDVDNVETGAGGKNQKPHDHYWDWSASPYFPEVRAAIEKITAFEKEKRFQLFIDLHNPGPTGRNSFFYVPAKPLLVPERIKEQENFFKIAKEEMTGPSGFYGKLGPIGETWDREKEPGSDCWIADNCRPNVLSLTLETPWNVPDATQDGYIKRGQQVGKTIARYFNQ